MPDFSNLARRKSISLQQLLAIPEAKWHKENSLPEEVKMSEIQTYYTPNGLMINFNDVTGDYQSKSTGLYYASLKDGTSIQVYSNFSEYYKKWLAQKPKESKMKEIINDLKKFVSEHRNIIYTVALVALADHFLFDGKFREKLKGLVDKMLNKAEKQLDNQ